MALHGIIVHPRRKGGLRDLAIGQEEQERRWRQALSQLNTWKRGDQRAVHKPLLTLMLIARAASNASRHIHFAEIADALTRPLKEFGPSRTHHHPEFPFWHLQSDGFWGIENPRNFPFKPRGRSPAKRTLVENNAVGAVLEDLWDTLRRSPSLWKELTQQLLDEFWPSTLHTAIRQAIGLPQPTDDIIATIRRATRLPRFREEILRAYQRRCAVCGYDGRLADIPLGLEAAHIKWHAYQDRTRWTMAWRFAPFTILHWMLALWDSVTICTFWSPATSMVRP